MRILKTPAGNGIKIADKSWVQMLCEVFEENDARALRILKTLAENGLKNADKAHAEYRRGAGAFS